nr:glycosyltransferase family 4 protein [uncultured Pseudomonas sp.]
MIVWCLVLLVFLSSWVLTLCLRQYALSRSLMDVPNERSAHTVPTPRGGGVAIVVSFLVTSLVVTQLNLLDIKVLYALFGAGALVALIGFADDHGHIAAKWRLLGHFIAAGWALFWLGGLAPLEIFNTKFDLGWIGHFLALIYLVWMLNLYNFMDGIDGLASAEAISVCLGMCLIYWLGAHAGLVWGPMLLAAAVAGFFCWNFPPARIFMGDAGSGFLGVTLGIIALQAAWQEPALLWSWIILLGVFIVDSTWTLARRLLKSEKVYQAHSSHGYQHAARRFGHKRVTMTVVVINVAYLLPLSVLVALDQLSGFSGLLIAFAPLVVIANMLNAGQARAV